MTTTPFRSIQNFIDGAWCDPLGQPLGILKNPNDGSFLADQVTSTPEQVDAAITAAVAAHRRGDWSKASVTHRVAIVEQMVEDIERYEGSLGHADAVHTGINIALMSQVASSLKFITQDFCRAAPTILQDERHQGQFGTVVATRVPKGPVVIIVPWNVPCGTIMPKLMAALLAGCSVILKPSEWAPTSIVLLIRAMTQRLGERLPKGSLQVVLGGPLVGQQLVHDARIRAVQFTGSIAVGKAVGAVCGAQLKPMLLELGGSNCAIVFPDADLDITIPCLVKSLTFLNGQWCMGVGRILCHASLQETVFSRLLQALAGLQVGTSTQPLSLETLGPLSFAGHAEKLRSLIEELEKKGGTVHRISSGEPPVSAVSSVASFFQPCLITGVPHATASAIELFGPLATFYPFSNEEEALALANENTGKLAAYVFSTNVDKAMSFGSQLATGMVMLNGVATGFSMHDGVAEPEIEFWNDAGYGTDGSPSVLLRFFSSKIVVGPNGPATKC